LYYVVNNPYILVYSFTSSAQLSTSFLSSCVPLLDLIHSRAWLSLYLIWRQRRSNTLLCHLRERFHHI